MVVCAHLLVATNFVLPLLAVHFSCTLAVATTDPCAVLHCLSAPQAKTSIPGLGKPITAVDVTYDGNWVLATTDDYLMVVKTSFEDDGEPPRTD